MYLGMFSGELNLHNDSSQRELKRLTAKKQVTVSICISNFKSRLYRIFQFISFEVRNTFNIISVRITLLDMHQH